jgi:hypothetical protein
MPVASHTVGNHPRLVNDPYFGLKNIGPNYGLAFQGLKACSALPNGMTASATLSHNSKQNHVTVELNPICWSLVGSQEIVFS